MPARTKVLSVIASVAMLAAVAAGSVARAVTALPAISFDTPTVVDNYRPGFEPDVVVSKSGDTYTSTPFGFSTTQSFIYRSDDHRKSFHLTEGQVVGKPLTCIGGGDTEMQIDPVSGAIYFVDLQGLTNFGTSRSDDRGATWSTTCTGVNGLGVDRQWVGMDTNGGRSAIGDGDNGGRLYLDYDNIFQNTDPSHAAGNQLVMNESIDGVHYGSLCQAAGAPCLGPAAVITKDEGIPGNIVVDNVRGSRFLHRVYAIHTDDAGRGVIVSYCSGAKGDNTAAKVAANCTDPTQVSHDLAHVNVYWHDSFPRRAGNYLTGNLFAAIAMDRAGNLYAVWSEIPADSNDNPTGKGVVKLAVSTNGAQSWSKPITVSPSSLGNNVMPWIAAGDRGRVDIAWYGAPQAKNASGKYGPDTLDAGTWNVYLAQSLDALTSKPSFSVTKVTDHQTKFGNISTQGLGGSPDRSLGDFMQVAIGSRGEAIVSYVDDTSADRNPDFCRGCGQTPAQAAGPIMIATQNAGPSLYASVGVVKGSARAIGSVTDAKGDAAYFAQGDKASVPTALDVTGASIHQIDPAHLRVTLTTNASKLAQDLSVDPTVGGPVGEWIVRWAAPTYRHPGDGNIFYVGMESSPGSDPEFYTGSTGAVDTFELKYFTFNKTTDIPGKISGNTISWVVPLAAIGSPKPGDGLFSVTGFTASQQTPSFASSRNAPNGSNTGEVNIPNVFDATPPFTYKLGTPPAAHAVQTFTLTTSASTGGPKTHTAGKSASHASAIAARASKTTPAAAGGAAAGMLVGVVALIGTITRRRRHT